MSCFNFLMTFFFLPPEKQKQTSNSFFFFPLFSVTAGINTERLAIVLEQGYVDNPNFRISKFVF